MEYNTTNDEPIKVSYTLTEDDYANHLFKAYFYKKWMFVLYGFRIVLLITCVYLFFVFRNHLDAMSPMIYIVSGAAIYLLLIPFLLKRKNRKQFRSMKNGSLPTWLTITQDKLVLEDELSSTDLKWEKLVKINQFDKMYQLYLTKSQFAMIPKEAFTTDQAAYFEKLAEDHGLWIS